jgi:hypothetical protein
MTDYIAGRWYSIFAAEEMNLVSQVSQTFGGLKKVPFGTALEIKTLMNESYLHLANRVD